MPEPRNGIAGLDEELARQRAVMVGRSPPYARTIELLPSVLSGAAGRLVEAAWRQRRFVASYERPLLLLAALRNDALAEGPPHPLWRGLAAPVPSPEAVTEDALRAAFDGSHMRVFDALAHRTVQTNETSRAVAWLWPAALAGASGGGRAIALADVGASAGLNLVADDLPAIWTDEDGSPLDVARRVRAVARLGLDEAPLDGLREEDSDPTGGGRAARDARLGGPRGGRCLTRLGACRGVMRVHRSRELEPGSGSLRGLRDPP
jgi:hypothetical protein